MDYEREDQQPNRNKAKLHWSSERPCNAYETLWDFIAEKIEHAGYEVRKPRRQQRASSKLPESGLDLGKRPPSSLFYLPCQAEDPSQSFFTDHREDGRAILDAEVWFTNSVLPFRQPRPEAHARTTERHGELNQSLIEAATTKWRESRLHEGEGNDRFWDYALNLRAAGMNFREIEAKLYEEAQFARHPDQRLAQISSIMTSLRQTRRRAG